MEENQEETGTGEATSEETGADEVTIDQSAVDDALAPESDVQAHSADLDVHPTFKEKPY